MHVETSTHSAGFPVYTVRSGDNTFELSAFGAQLLSWTKAGVSIMFANREHAIFDGKAPYRGGAPICFPYFSKGALLPSKTLLAPQHGAARTTVWSSEVREAESAILFRTEQPSPDGFGPTSLGCEMAYFFTDDLRIEARILNEGENATPLQLAIHSYWATEDPAQATIQGLGARYLDNLSGLQERQDPDPAGPHMPPFDRVYPDAADQLELVTERFRLTVATEGGAGAVLWNPGQDHPIADLGTPDFVCLESGIIAPPRNLQPGEECRFHLTYHAEIYR